MKEDEKRCCWLPPGWKEQLDRPGMTLGDQRQWVDEHACRESAAWVIHRDSLRLDSCSAHVGDLMSPHHVSTVWPLAGLELEPLARLEQGRLKDLRMMVKAPYLWKTFSK